MIEYTPTDATDFYGKGGIGPGWADPDNALGPVDHVIVSMGDMDEDEISRYTSGIGYGPATLTLGFDRPIVNGPGADFAAFESGFISNHTTPGGSVSGQMWAELGYVEVSTNGENFARFPCTYSKEGVQGTADYLTLDVTRVHNLVGKHANNYKLSWGKPFNLDDLCDDALVNLDEINFVRIVDIPGEGTFKDSQDNSIYDGWLTWRTGGVDFDSLGVIHQSPVPVPGAVLLLGSGLIGLIGFQRKMLN